VIRALAIYHLAWDVGTVWSCVSCASVEPSGIMVCASTPIEKDGVDVTEALVAAECTIYTLLAPQRLLCVRVCECFPRIRTTPPYPTDADSYFQRLDLHLLPRTFGHRQL
jgi:hypothetical protein